MPIDEKILSRMQATMAASTGTWEVGDGNWKVRCNAHGISDDTIGSQ